MRLPCNRPVYSGETALRSSFETLDPFGSFLEPGLP